MSVMELCLPPADPRCEYLRARRDTVSLQHCVSLHKHILTAALLVELGLFLDFLCDKMQICPCCNTITPRFTLLWISILIILL